MISHRLRPVQPTLPLDRDDPAAVQTHQTSTRPAPPGSPEWSLTCTPAERRRHRRGLRLARLLREHWPEVGPAVLELLAPALGRLIAGVLAAREDQTP
jgi:hypothetical protein